MTSLCSPDECPWTSSIMYLDMCLLMTFLPVCSIPQSLHIWEASWLLDPAHLRHSPTSRGFTWAKMLKMCSEINPLSDLGDQPKKLTNKQWSTYLAWWCPTIIGINCWKKRNIQHNKLIGYLLRLKLFILGNTMPCSYKPILEQENDSWNPKPTFYTILQHLFQWLMHHPAC